jgi:hypothetical protein
MHVVARCCANVQHGRGIRDRAYYARNPAVSARKWQEKGSMAGTGRVRASKPRARNARRENGLGCNPLGRASACGHQLVQRTPGQQSPYRAQPRTDR